MMLQDFTRKPFQVRGVNIHSLTAEDLAFLISRAVESKSKILVFYINLHGLVLAWKNPGFKEILNRADWVLCDGEAGRYASKAYGYKPPEKIALTRWIWDLAAFCSEKQYRLFLLGAQPGVADEAARCLKEKHPALLIAGTQHGYFKQEGPENERLIQTINESKADILMVGLGMPRQEEWLMRNKAQLNPRVAIACGGALDYAAGDLGEAPQWMIAARIEWVFRIWEEPVRLAERYLTEIPYFFICIFWDKLKHFFKTG